MFAEGLTKYLEELTFYFRTRGVGELGKFYLFSRAMTDLVEGWFHVIEN